MQFLEHAGGFLAARHAQVQPLFLAGKDRTRVILAVVAALAAILLRHRRHHLPAQRLGVGQLHALGQRQGLVVPGRAVVIVGGSPGVGSRARDERRRLLAGKRRDAKAIERHQAGKETVEPDPLLLGERRGFRHQRGERRRQILRHSPASAANICFSASTSWRRENARKVSSRDTRCAR